ncbi:MAG: MltR family transcriptional regulator [Brevundimonas sp.]|uniref:MltR family transcriptional regulator n=1 Tax=Brevundimonas sp. TaxID=1871086 RepID=UPI00391C59AC
MAKRSSLKHLSRDTVSFSDHLDGFSASIKGSDLEAVIISVSLIENALERTIRDRFRELSQPEVDDLFSGTGALSSLSAKIHIGYAIGILGKKAKHDLLAMKDIRNAFAHSAKAISFDTPEVAQKCAGVHHIKEVGSEYEGDLRDKFLAAARVFCFLLNVYEPTRIEVEGLGDLSDDTPRSASESSSPTNSDGDSKRGS